MIIWYRVMAVTYQILKIILRNHTEQYPANLSSKYLLERLDGSVELGVDGRVVEAKNGQRDKEERESSGLDRCKDQCSSVKPEIKSNQY